MEERNKYLEMDGLYWESETHEWFHDKINTQYARTDNGLHKDALPNIYCFVVREKTTGEYDRVAMDSKTNEVIYSTKVLEDMGFFIDRLKIAKRFNVK
jgi:isocitrate/isopropylmalate dehydrogenase